jgi:Ras-related protein Rab-5C
MTEAEVKIVLVGNASVGKTCIVTKATSGTFDDESVPTLGASYLPKTVAVGKTNVNLQLWDTAGQERYRGLTPMYYRDARIALIVYSVTDPASFEGITDWFTSLTEHADADTKLFLVGNKIDLDERKVEESEGQRKAEEIKAEFAEVSAKTGAGIDVLFLRIAESFLERTPDLIRTGGEASLPLAADRDAQPKGSCC